ncbi:MAG: dTDP-4-dehydrorhamnose reductase [Nitrospirota bacterium]|nr:dTDP-4-dehydrorhamnose reductase [Nitrospirota bacterium]
MKVAITGADGMLGRAMQKIFSDTELIPFSHASLDITDLDHAVKTLRDSRPDILIHTAAFTDVDACETDPEKAYLVNGIGARNMAIACEEIRCPIFHISSDYVFDGTKGSPYDEWDKTNPINHYGLSKLMAEQFVSSLTNRFYIVRTSWLYGAHGRNFVDTIIRLLAGNDSLQVVSDQFGSPTFTEDLAATLRQLIGKGYGTYHVTNSGVCTWHEFAVKISDLIRIDKPIIPVTSEEFRRPARRPTQSGLNNTMLRLEGIAHLRHWSAALEQHIKQNYSGRV